MTTITARDGVMAGDGVETDEEMIVHKSLRKVFKLPDGRVVGFAGSSEQAHVMLDCMKKKAALPRLEHAVGLMIDTNGKLWIYEGMLWRRFQMPFYAIGTGAYFAIAAMKAGADAVKACRIGAEMDPGSGGRVRSVKIGKRKAKLAG